MSLLGISFFLISSSLFLLWYVGTSKPLSNEELEELLSQIIAKNNLDNDDKLISQLRTLCINDSGKEFYMVNLMKFKEEYNEELKITPQDAHKLYSKGIIKELIKRAGHPVFLSKISGSFIQDSHSEWDELAIVRYRSKRDMLKMISNINDKKLGKYKWASLKDTHVYPTRRVFSFGDIRVAIIAILLLLSFFI